MFTIKKTDPPKEFAQWETEIKEELAPKLINDHHTGTQLWDDFSSREDFPKERIRRALLEEQGYICCYCGKRIENNGLYCSIEHFKPKSIHKQSTFNYRNLFASCKGKEKKINHKVSEGDSYDSISTKYGLSVDYIISVNNNKKLKVNDIVQLSAKKNNKKTHCDNRKGHAEVSFSLYDHRLSRYFIYQPDGTIDSIDEYGKEDIKTLGLEDNDELKQIRIYHFKQALKKYKSLKKIFPDDYKRKLHALSLQYSQKQDRMFHPMFFIYLQVWSNN